ncbi:MAG: protein kinase domain-containing protein [Pirellulales bacterium]
MDWADQDYDVVDGAVARLKDAWTTRGEAVLGEFLPAAKSALRRRVLTALIKIDQDCRWKAGKRRMLETYPEWPELAGHPEAVEDLLAEECRTRASHDDIPTQPELETRFPNLAAKIDLPAILGEVRRDGPGAPAEDTSGVSLASTQARGVALPILSVGERFGRYEIRAEPLEGGMGLVYRAYDPPLDREVALKIPRFDPAADPIVLERFVREAKAAAKVSHANICPIYDAGRVEGTPYIAMAWIEGQSLDKWLKGLAVAHGEVAVLVRKIAAALEAVHTAGLVHRDIKPSNVMLDQSGEPRLMDFGLARLADPECRQVEGTLQSPEQAAAGNHLTHPGVAPGTPAYMSPEQVDGRAADARSDVYGTGALLYQALTGRLPFAGSVSEVLAKIRSSEPPKPRSLRPELDRDLEAICLKAMAKNANDRYPTAGKLAEALDGYLRRSTRSAWSRWTRGPRVWILAAAAAAIFLAGTVIYCKTGEGTLVLEINEPGATVTIDGDEVQVASPRGEVSVAVGQHELTVRQGDFTAHAEPFTIRWRDSRVDRAVRLPPAMKIERWIETEPKIFSIRLSPDGSTLYVPSREDYNQSPVQIFKTSSGQPARAPILFPKAHDKGHGHGDVAISGDNRYVYLTNFVQKYITRIDLKDNDRRTDLPVGKFAENLVLTPNGKQALVVAGQDGRPDDEVENRLLVFDVVGDGFSLARQQRLDDEPISHHIAFSSDGKRAYLVARRPKTRDLALYQIDLVQPYGIVKRRLFAGAGTEGCDVAMSNELGRLFVSDAQGKSILAFDLVSLECVSRIDLGGYRPGTVSLDAASNVLAVLCPNNKAMLCVNAKQGTILARVTGLREGAMDVEFSPDGRHAFISHMGLSGGIAVIDWLGMYPVVFASNRAGGTYQLYLTRSGEDKTVRLTNNLAEDRCPRWSPDGRRIAFISDRDGPARICVLDVAKGETTVIPDTDPMMPNVTTGATLDWSPTGTRIAFVGDTHRVIRVVDLRTREIRTPVPGKVAGGRDYHIGLCWSRSDGAILFTSNPAGSAYDRALFLIDPKTDKVERMAHATGTFYDSTPASSPEGKKIATVRAPSVEPPQAAVWLMNADGTNPVRLAGVESGIVASPRWFPDGRNLIFSARSGLIHRLYTMSVAGGEPTPLAGGQGDDIEPDVRGQ